MLTGCVSYQSDNKALSSKLAEKIAEERAKALLKSVETRKRPADEAVQSSGSVSSEQPNASSKKQKQKGKGKSRGKNKTK